MVLRGHHPTLHVDDEALDTATGATADASAVVSVGGGTITDIAKVATGRSGAARAGTGAAQETAGQGGIPSWSCRPRPPSTATRTTSRSCCATA